MLRHVFAIVIFTSLAASQAQVAPAANQKITTPMRPLLEALAKAGVSGSLELSERCTVGQPFPILRYPSTDGESLLQVVREIFANDAAIQVTQDPDGTVRMIENGAQTDLLSVRISHISFEIKGVPLQYAAFSPNTALMQILRSPEVVAFMKAHDMMFAIRQQGSFGNEPHSLDSPHIAESMDKVTLSQALDRVLKTFPGLWFYEICSKDNEKVESVFLMFFNLQDSGLVEEPVNKVSHRLKIAR